MSRAALPLTRRALYLYARWAEADEWGRRLMVSAGWLSEPEGAALTRLTENVEAVGDGCWFRSLNTASWRLKDEVREILLDGLEVQDDAAILFGEVLCEDAEQARVIARALGKQKPPTRKDTDNRDRIVTLYRKHGGNVTGLFSSGVARKVAQEFAPPLSVSRVRSVVAEARTKAGVSFYTTGPDGRKTATRPTRPR